MYQMMAEFCLFAKITNTKKNNKQFNRNKISDSAAKGKQKTVDATK